jgi:hypothetical protein
MKFKSNCLLFAVGGGADLVRNVDTTLAGEASGKIRVEASDASGCIFQAVASRLAVGRGPGGVVYSPDALAAGYRRNAAVLQVDQAWREVAFYLWACQGRLGNGWCGHHHAQEDRAYQLKATHCVIVRTYARVETKMEEET